MDKIKLVLLDELEEVEDGGFLIPADAFFDSIVQLSGLTYVVLYTPSELGGVCGCVGVEPGLGGGDVQPAFLF